MANSIANMAFMGIQWNAKSNSSVLDSAQKDFLFKSYSFLKFFGKIYIVKILLNIFFCSPSSWKLTIKKQMVMKKIINRGIFRKFFGRGLEAIWKEYKAIEWRTHRTDLTKNALIHSISY